MPSDVFMLKFILITQVQTMCYTTPQFNRRIKSLPRKRVLKDRTLWNKLYVYFMMKNACRWCSYMIQQITWECLTSITSFSLSKSCLLHLINSLTYKMLNLSLKLHVFLNSFLCNIPKMRKNLHKLHITI